ncbi:IFIH1-like protein [Mya arenaria]|uniref:IFIH1-like protein n=1 Tax=Mya arenaria TaxID=6604 RepID=A0ABY7FNC5_MYAAR|nr:IFIH1-like protein [Mya arenaria]
MEKTNPKTAKGGKRKQEQSSQPPPKHNRLSTFPEETMSKDEDMLAENDDQEDLGSNVDEEDISLRGYQEELAKEGCEGSPKTEKSRKKDGSYYISCRKRSSSHSARRTTSLLIVGLTASLGVGGKTEKVQGLNHMKKIMANMDAKFLCTVRTPDTIEQLKRFANPPVEELLPVHGRDVDLFKIAVQEIAKNMFDYMTQAPEPRIETFANEPENPKLIKLEEILLRVLSSNQNARGIIFVRTKELAQALVRWVNETDSLKGLNASEFTGQGAAASDGGMTKSGQKNALQFFKDGQHRLLIATSVAEEGLDISKCNLVIRYEHVTNEIVRLQSRGRARAENSLYYVIAEEGSWILEKEERNFRCEKLMEKIVPDLQLFIEDPANFWERELLDIQEKMKREEERQAQQRAVHMATTGARFECFNCSSLICLSDDIRVIKGAHHVIIDEEAKRRLILKKGATDFEEPEGAKYGGVLLCANEECQRQLGSVCTYNCTEFPLMGLKNFRVVDQSGKGRQFKKWNQVNCRLEEFTFDELNAVVAERLAIV